MGAEIPNTFQWWDETEDISILQVRWGPQDLLRAPNQRLTYPPIRWAGRKDPGLRDESRLPCSSAVFWWKSRMRMRKAKSKRCWESGEGGWEEERHTQRDRHPSYPVVLPILLLEKKIDLLKLHVSLHITDHSFSPICCASILCPVPLAGQYQSFWQTA